MDAEFTYDAENKWFKANCLPEDWSSISYEFQQIVNHIEKTEFRKHREAIMNGDGTLKVS